MKNNILFLAAITIFISCNATSPQNSIEDLNSSSATINTIPIDNQDNNVPVLTDDSSNVTAPGYEHCSNTTPFNGQSIGMFGLCRHSSDERKFRVKFANGSTSGTCFVPTHRLNNGTSFKLGIAECVHNQAGFSYYMTLNKETVAPTFTNTRSEPINSVMVLSANAVNAYMGCMNAKESYLLSARQILGNNRSPACCYQAVNSPTGLRCLQTNPNCEQAANSHASTVCSDFVQNYSRQYKQVIF